MIAIADTRGDVLSPLTIVPVTEVDSVLLPEGLKGLKRVTREVGLDLTGAVLNLDAGFDSKASRKCAFNAGMKPNLKENPRNRQKPKRGCKRFFDEVLYTLRFTLERTFAWEDKAYRNFKHPFFPKGEVQLHLWVIKHARSRFRIGENERILGPLIGTKYPMSRQFGVSRECGTKGG